MNAATAELVVGPDIDVIMFRTVCEMFGLPPVVAPASYAPHIFETARLDIMSGTCKTLFEEQQAMHGLPHDALCYSSEWMGNLCLLCYVTCSEAHLRSRAHNRCLKRGTTWMKESLAKTAASPTVFDLYKYYLYKNPELYWYPIADASRNGLSINGAPWYPLVAYMHTRTGFTLPCDESGIVATDAMWHGPHQISTRPLFQILDGRSKYFPVQWMPPSGNSSPRLPLPIAFHRLPYGLESAANPQHVISIRPPRLILSAMVRDPNTGIMLCVRVGDLEFF